MLLLPGEIVVVIAAAATLGVYVLIILAYRQWQRALVDSARGQLFEARDNVFLLFASSPLGVDAPVHRRVREFFNISIRHAHKLTLWRLVLAWLLLPRPAAPVFGREYAELSDHPGLREAVFREIAVGHVAFTA
jgi:hypothetical protein